MVQPEAIISPDVAALLPLAWGGAGVILSRLLAPPDRPRWMESPDRVVFQPPEREEDGPQWTYPGAGWPEPRLASLRGPEGRLKPPAGEVRSRPAARSARPGR